MHRLMALAAATAAVALGTSPAAAHSCSAPVEIPVGESTTIVLGVPAELQPVVGVDITVPSGFRLDKAEDVGPWRVERDGAQLRYRGGELAPYACASFMIQGAAERQAQLAFPMTVHGADGSRVEFSSEDPNDLHAAQVVYAGFSPPTEDGGSGGVAVSTIGVVAAAAAVAGAFLLSRRQQRRARPAPGRTPSSRPATKRRSSRARRRR